MYMLSFIRIRFRLGPLTLNIARCLFLVEKHGQSILRCLLPQTSSCASKPLLLRCNLVIPQYMCQVSLGLKEVRMGPITLKVTRCLFLVKKTTGKINTSMSAAPKLALAQASRYYCDVNWSYHNVCAKFHKD